MTDNRRAVLELEAAKAELEALTKEVEAVEEVVAEEVTTEKPVEKAKYTALEQEQMERGWTPKDQFKGDPEDWVPAKEFKRVGEIIEAKRAASKESLLKTREVEDLTKTVRQLVEQQRKAEEIIRKRTLDELEQKRLLAVQDGDIKRVLEVEAEQAVQKAAALVEPVAPEIKPLSAEAREFQEKNKDWLEGTSASDRAMQSYVQARIQEYMNTNPNIDEKIAIQSIEEGLVEEFPHKFSNPNKNKAAMVSSSTTSGASKGSYGISRLDTNMRLEYESIKKADPTYSVKEYIEQLELVGRLK